MAGPSRRTLARTLETLSDFDAPTPELEQYLTPPDLASHVCHVARLQGDLERRVVDLGTGTGMLAVATALAGAECVVGVDVDRAALEVARENARRVGRSGELEWVCADVTAHPLAVTSATVVSNPPFGAQYGNRHADRAFLEAACELAEVSYTFHNEGSKTFVESFASDHGGELTHAFQASFSIERRFDFHDATERTLETELFRIEWS